MITVTTVIPMNFTTAAPFPTQTTDSGAFNPSSSPLAGLPPGPNGSNGQTQKSGGNNTNVPAAALGAVGGVAAIALIVFGFVMTRKRKRLREDQARDLSIYGASVGGGAGGATPVMAAAGYGDDLYGDKDYGYGYGTAAGGGAAMGAGGSAPSLPSLHQAGSYVPRPDPTYQSGHDYSYAAAGAGIGAAAALGAYGYEDMEEHNNNSRRVSDQSAGSGGSLSRAVAGAGAAAVASNPTLLAFPVPPTTSNALKQQYDLANRMSVASQDSLTDSFNGPSDDTPVSHRAGAAISLGAGAAAAAVNHLMMLKQTFDDEDAAAAAAAGANNHNDEVTDIGDSQSLYYLDTGSPSQPYLSAREISPLMSGGSEAEGIAGSMADSSEYGTQLAATPNMAAANGYSHMGGATGSQPTATASGYHTDAFTRSSAYETSPGSDVFASAADSSPAMSYSNVSSMGSPNTQILNVPNVTNIRDLIRNVLNEDDE